MSLIDFVTGAAKRPVLPLMGSVGTRLAGLKIGDCLRDPALHLAALRALVETFDPVVLLPIMDLTREAEALGIPITTAEDEPPSVAGHPVTGPQALAGLQALEPERDGRLPACLEVASGMRELTPGLTGFYVIGPFTLAAELAGAEELAVCTITEPSFTREVIEFARDSIISYAGQLAQRVDLIVVLEPSVVMLSPATFARFAQPALTDLMGNIRTAGAFPVLHICGDTTHLFGAMAECGADGYSLDAPVDMREAALKLGPDRVVMGNIDPVGVMLEGGRIDVETACARLLSEMSGIPGFVLAPGCDLPADTPPGNISALLAQ